MSISFEFKPYRTAFARPLHTAHGEWAEREGVIIRLTDESGRTAFGEIAPIPWFGTETLERALDLCRSFDTQLDAGRIAGISDALPCCQFAFGSALGALGDRVDSSNRSATVACLLPAGPSALIRLKHAVSEGFTRFKWKVGVADVDTELEVLRKMRAKLPKGALLRLDANGAWDRSIAEGWITACEGAPIEFIEQPFPAGADNLLMEFGSAHPGLFALDESVTPPGALHQWLERGWPGVVVVKPSLCGEPKRLRRLLVESGADVVFSTALETTFGWHSARRFALGHPNAKRALGFGAGQMFKSTSLSPDAAKPMVQTGETDRAHEEIWRQLAP